MKSIFHHFYRAIIEPNENYLFGGWEPDFKSVNKNVLVITTAKLHSTKPELRLFTGINPARGVMEFAEM